MRFNPGDRVKDIISGFTGIVICRTEWIYGCVRIGVQPEKTAEGKPLESYTFDEPQLKLVKRAVVKATPIPNPELEETPHGDRPNPIRRMDANRR